MSAPSAGPIANSFLFAERARDLQSLLSAYQYTDTDAQQGDGPVAGGEFSAATITTTTSSADGSGTNHEAMATEADDMYSDQHEHEQQQEQDQDNSMFPLQFASDDEN